MILIVLMVVVQIGLILHVVKTGRQMYWVFILLIAPGIGGLAYFIVEILPDLTNSAHGRKAARTVRNTLNPGADLRQKEKQLQLSGSVDAARHLASELLESGRVEEAIKHYEGALSGLYEHDPDLLLGLAQARFANEEFEKSRDTLDLLMEKNPEFRSSDGHLLYARSVEACGDDMKALDEYKAVSAYYAGAEAKVRYAQALEKSGDTKAALSEFEDILTAAELAPRHYRTAQKEWINLAKSGVTRLKD